MDHAFARAFADEWVKAWNSRDLEQVLSHFADNVVFTSPVAAQVLDGSDGVLHGKAALRAYWAEGLRRVPDLHFEVGQPRAKPPRFPGLPGRPQDRDEGPCPGVRAGERGEAGSGRRRGELPTIPGASPITFPSFFVTISIQPVEPPGLGQRFSGAGREAGRRVSAPHRRGGS